MESEKKIYQIVKKDEQLNDLDIIEIKQYLVTEILTCSEMNNNLLKEVKNLWDEKKVTRSFKEITLENPVQFVEFKSGFMTFRGRLLTDYRMYIESLEKLCEEKKDYNIFREFRRDNRNFDFIPRTIMEILDAPQKYCTGSTYVPYAADLLEDPVPLTIEGLSQLRDQKIIAQIYNKLNKDTISKNLHKMRPEFLRYYTTFNVPTMSDLMRLEDHEYDKYESMIHFYKYKMTADSSAKLNPMMVHLQYFHKLKDEKPGKWSEHWRFLNQLFREKRFNDIHLLIKLNWFKAIGPGILIEMAHLNYAETIKLIDALNCRSMRVFERALKKIDDFKPRNLSDF